MFCLYQDSRNRIWAGSSGSGLFYFDEASREFKGLNEEISADYIRKSTYISSILEDAGGALWVTTLYGLYSLDFHNENKYDVTAQQNLWFGTGDYGLEVRPYGQALFRHMDKGDGLASNAIRGLLQDANGNMWISTNAGMSKYDPASQSFRNYTKEDGFPSNEFNANACLMASDGSAVEAH